MTQDEFQNDLLIQPWIIHPLAEKIISPPEIVIRMRQISTILDC